MKFIGIKEGLLSDIINKTRETVRDAKRAAHDLKHRDRLRAERDRKDAASRSSAAKHETDFKTRMKAAWKKGHTSAGVA